MGEGLVLEMAGVVDKKLGREVVRAVNDEIVGPYEVADVRRGEERAVRNDVHVRIDGPHLLRGGHDLLLANVRQSRKPLPGWL